MCGRYALTLPPEAIRAFFGYVEQPNFPPRHNIAPTQPIAIVRCDRDGRDPAARHFALVRWGFVPSFVKDFKAFRPLVNARGEGIDSKPSFRNAFRRRRCLVVADAFYEWRQLGGGNPPQPFLLRHPDRRPLGLAGITETWMGADGSEIETACIITTAAIGVMAGLHHRMPLVIDPVAFDVWLDPDERNSSAALDLLRPRESGLEAVPIGNAVNKVANDDPSIQDPVGTLAAAPAPTGRRPDEAQGSLF